MLKKVYIYHVYQSINQRSSQSHNPQCAVFSYRCRCVNFTNTNNYINTQGIGVHPASSAGSRRSGAQTCTDAATHHTHTCSVAQCAAVLHRAPCAPGLKVPCVQLSFTQVTRLRLSSSFHINHIKAKHDETPIYIVKCEVETRSFIIHQMLGLPLNRLNS